ncbi:MAG TPA: response regulator [Anaerolineae bacterium]|nr:response regulator [Anaerolineae bacterium]
MHILVVDPNDVLAMLLTEELKRLGYEVTQCATSAEALQIARDHQPALAMLDMALESPDTLTLANQLREVYADIRLVLTPFMGETPSLDDSIPIQGVLPKPIFPPELPNRLEVIFKIPPDRSAAEEVLPEPSPPAGATLTPPPVEPVAAEPAAPEEPSQASPKAVSAPAIEFTEGGAFGETEGGLSYDAFVQNRLRVERLMGNLAQELGADAVLLTYGGGLLTWVGGLTQGEAESISRAVVHGWRTSAQVARILGREQVRFEQSIAGDDYMLYALSVEVNAIIAVAVRGAAPLGLLRHRARSAAEEIARLCAA